MSVDKYRIDSHKLMYHIDRLYDWQQGKSIYPIYMEVSPSGTCNHRCTYCALDFMEYQRRFLDTAILKDRLTEMGQLGLKSIMYAGEGEPFLHKDLPQIITHTARSGIDAAVTTNAVLFKPEYADEVLANTAWLKVSINGATAETYAKIHRTSPDDFKKVVSNMSYAARQRQKNNYNCTLGMQLLLLPDNSSEAVALAKLARNIGMDYLVIKPYSQHPLSKTKLYENINYEKYMPLADELAKINTKDFSVIFRIHAMEKWDSNDKPYKRCLALPFWSYIDAGGNVWGCSMFLGDKRFYYGNIQQNSFEEIWQGQTRKQSLHWVENEFDASQCRINCRMDEINRYLWGLKTPPLHVNFI